MGVEDRAPALIPAPRGSLPSGKLGRFVRGSLAREVLFFGLPLVLGMGLHTAFNLVDMYMIGRLENASAALAALGICDMVAAVATILSNGISTAAVALLGRCAGAGDLTGVRRVAWQSLLLVGILSVVFGLLGVFGSDFVIRVLMQAKGEAADLAVGYLTVILGGCFSIFFLLQITAILRALGHAKTAASLLIGGNALNIVLNIFLIYGEGPYPDVFAWAAPVGAGLGIPRLGVLGAAWATLAGRTVPVLVGAALLARRRGGPRFHRVYLRPMGAEIKKLLTIGWPSSAQLVVRVGTVLVLISLINANFTTVGDHTTLTAYSICLRLETMALFIGMGWGAAASSFVGANLGAGQAHRAKRAGLLAALYNLVVMVGLTTLYLTCSDAIVGFFDAAPEVIRAGHEYLGTVALTYGLLGLGIVLSQAMTGAGATLSSFLLDGAVLLLGVIPAAYVVTEVLGQGPGTLWVVVALGNVVAAAAYLVYYARGAFLHKRL